MIREANTHALLNWRVWLRAHPPVERLLVTGSRTWTDQRLIGAVLMCPELPASALLVEGEADGADMIAASLWRVLGRPIEPHPLPEGWHRTPMARVIPLARDQAMVDTMPDVAVAFWRGNSPGTRATIGMVRRAEIPVFIFGQEA